MTLTHRPLDPVADLDLVHGWVTQERAEFWGMTDHTREEVGEVYAYLDSLSTHHAYLVHEVAAAPGDAVPVAIFQTYEPQHDPVGEAYAVQEGDLGVHLVDLAHLDAALQRERRYAVAQVPFQVKAVEENTLGIRV